MECIEVGKAIEWSSRGGTRRGKVVAHVPATADVTQVIEKLPASRYNLKNINAKQPRTMDSYLVESPGPTGQSKPYLYWPHVKNLLNGNGRVVDEEN